MSARRSRPWTLAAVIGSLTVGLFTRPAILRVLSPRPRFLYASVPLSPSAYDALAARPGWAKASQAVAADVSLNGLVRRPARADAPWILFYPGNDPSQLTNGQAMLDRLRGDRDWGLAVYSYRGYDSSGGRASIQTLTDDGYRMLRDLVTRERIEPSRLNVVAFSLGGYVAAGALGKASKDGTKVRTLSILAPAADMEMGWSRWGQRLVLGDRIDIMPLLDDVPGPVLVLHGAADATLPVAQGRAVAARLGARARFQEIAGAGHNDIVENAAALEAVRAMLESASLATGSPG